MHVAVCYIVHVYMYQYSEGVCCAGGFRDSEQETLVMLAQMGVYPSIQHLNDRLKHPRPYTRFRTAGRVVIAIARCPLTPHTPTAFLLQSFRAHCTCVYRYIVQLHSGTYMYMYTWTYAYSDWCCKKFSPAVTRLAAKLVM